MKIHKYTLGLILIMIMVTSSYGVTAQGVSDNITVDNENIAIKVTSNQNVPMYQYWVPGGNSTIYRVQFNAVFEAIDQNDNGQFDVGEDNKVMNSVQALSAWSWEFSEISSTEDETVFNITGDGSAAPRLGNFDLTFQNHLGEGSASLKIDVIIDNYSFKSDSDNTMLVLGFRLTAAESDAETESDSDSTRFGGGILEIEDTAQANEEVAVGITSPSNGSMMSFISYDRFKGQLVHDPTIGFAGIFDRLPVNPVYSLLGLFVLIPIVNRIRKQDRNLK